MKKKKKISLIIFPTFWSPLAKLLPFLPANLAPFLWLFLGMVTTSSCSSCGIDATFCRNIFSSVCAIRTISSVGYKKQNSSNDSKRQTNYFSSKEFLAPGIYHHLLKTTYTGPLMPIFSPNYPSKYTKENSETRQRKLIRKMDPVLFRSLKICKKQSQQV